MLEFIIMIVILVVCVMLFGKADSKKTLLNTVGLDLSEQNYQNSKEREFEKYCKKAMIAAVERYDAKGKDEKEFVDNLDYILYYSTHRVREEPDEFGITRESPSYNLGIKYNYKDFAYKVVNRRKRALKEPNPPQLLNNCDFTNKSHLKSYINKLWDKYQYPWPDDWLKNDGI